MIIKLPVQPTKIVITLYVPNKFLPHMIILIIFPHCPILKFYFFIRPEACLMALKIAPLSLDIKRK